VIKFKWAALPAEQREGIKNYTSNLIIKYSTNEQLYRAESTFISKLNLILVQILKQVRNAERPAVFLKLLAAVVL
jgi:exportin-1